MDSLEGFEGDLRLKEPLSKHTYFQIGGEADLFLAPKGLGDLGRVVRHLKDSQLPFYFIGRGSNLLVSDEGFRGVAIKTSRLSSKIEILEDQLQIGSGVVVSNLLRKAGERGWAGFEFLAGVPGSFGGVAWMNAGTHLGEAKDSLLKVEAVFLNIEEGTLESRFYEGEQLKYSYRKNHFLAPGELVLNTWWKLNRDEPSVVKAKIQDVLDRRKQTQPVDLPSCGSVFKNPKSSGLHAWQVMDKLELRGHKIGNACFSEKHCNFITNLGGAKASDVRSLISLAKDRAKAELGVELEEEVRYLGFRE